MALLNLDRMDPDPRDTWGLTPLHLAADRLRVDVVEYFLITKEVRVNAVTADGQTGFHIATESDCREILAPFTASARVNVNAQDKKGRTGLHLAVRRGNIAMISMILHRPDLNLELTTKSGKTARVIAQKKRNQGVLDLWSEYDCVRAEKCSVARGGLRSRPDIWARRPAEIPQYFFWRSLMGSRAPGGINIGQGTDKAHCPFGWQAMSVSYLSSPDSSEAGC
jgi:ankyrin repeat protein